MTGMCQQACGFTSHTIHREQGVAVSERDWGSRENLEVAQGGTTCCCCYQGEGDECDAVATSIRLQ